MMTSVDAFSGVSALYIAIKWFLSAPAIPLTSIITKSLLMQNWEQGRRAVEQEHPEGDKDYDHETGGSH